MNVHLCQVSGAFLVLDPTLRGLDRPIGPQSPDGAGLHQNLNTRINESRLILICFHVETDSVGESAVHPLCPVVAGGADPGVREWRIQYPGVGAPGYNRTSPHLEKKLESGWVDASCGDRWMSWEQAVLILQVGSRLKGECLFHRRAPVQKRAPGTGASPSTP